jgi:hypothetical protein
MLVRGFTEAAMVSDFFPRLRFLLAGL